MKNSRTTAVAIQLYRDNKLCVCQRIRFIQPGLSARGQTKSASTHSLCDPLRPGTQEQLRQGFGMIHKQVAAQLPAPLLRSLLPASISRCSRIGVG